MEVKDAAMRWMFSHAPLGAGDAVLMGALNPCWQQASYPDPAGLAFVAACHAPVRLLLLVCLISSGSGYSVLLCCGSLFALRLSLAGASSIEQLRRTLENTDASWDEPLPPALAEAFEAAWAALSVGAPHGVPLVGGVAPVASI